MDLEKLIDASGDAIVAADAKGARWNEERALRKRLAEREGKVK